MPAGLTRLSVPMIVGPRVSGRDLPSERRGRILTYPGPRTVQLSESTSFEGTENQENLASNVPNCVGGEAVADCEWRQMVNVPSYLPSVVL
jgi:hypothetical protein